MSITELQIRQTSLSAIIQHIATAQRLPSATIKIPFFPVLDNKPLDSIACVGCTFSTASDKTIFASLDLQFRFYTGLASVKAAGSLQQPPTETANHPLRLELSISVAPDGKASIIFKDPLSLIALGSLTSRGIDLDGMAPFPVVDAAIVLSEDDSVAVIRLVSSASESANFPATNHLAEGSDWTLFVSGNAFADIIGASLGVAIADVAKGNSHYRVEKAAAASYITFPLLGIAANPPYVLASAEVLAVNACPVFNIDIAVDLTLVASFVCKGKSIETTLTLSWSADSTWCQIADFFVATPVAPFVIARVAQASVSKAILGSGVNPPEFHEIARDTSSVTFRQERTLPVPTPLVITGSTFNNNGLMVSGGMMFQNAGQGLQGWVESASSGISVSCSPRSVSVRFNPAQVGLLDHSPPGDPPRIFPQSLVVPANAWIVVPGTGNDKLETLVTFADPPGGRLPAGTSTSVYLATDCGMRWIDLGSVPEDHAAPTLADALALVSQCFAKSAGWKERVMSVKWLPRPADSIVKEDPLRQWMVGLVGMKEGTQLQFFAMGKRGSDRLIGTVEGVRTFAAHITTTSHETLEVRSSSSENPEPQVVAQRWISPIASMRLDEAPLSIAAVGGVLGLLSKSGSTTYIEFDSAGRLKALSLERVSNNSNALIEELARMHANDERQTWHSVAHLDSRTIAIVHKDHLIIGTVGELQNVLG